MQYICSLCVFRATSASFHGGGEEGSFYFLLLLSFLKNQSSGGTETLYFLVQAPPATFWIKFQVESHIVTLLSSNVLLICSTLLKAIWMHRCNWGHSWKAVMLHRCNKAVFGLENLLLLMSARQKKHILTFRSQSESIGLAVGKQFLLIWKLNTFDMEVTEKQQVWFITMLFLQSHFSDYSYTSRKLSEDPLTKIAYVTNLSLGSRVIAVYWNENKFQPGNYKSLNLTSFPNTIGEDIEKETVWWKNLEIQGF